MNSLPAFNLNPTAQAVIIGAIAYGLYSYWPQIQAWFATAVPGAAPAAVETPLHVVMEAYAVCHAAGLEDVCVHLREAQAKIPVPVKEAPSATT